MIKASAKNNPKQLDAKREKRARQAQRRAEREHPNAALWQLSAASSSAAVLALLPH